MTMNANITAEELLAHSAWLQRLARRLVDPHTAEDLVQETWATAVRSNPDRERPLRPWLAEVLRNLVRMRARSAGRFAARVPAIAAGEAPLPSAEELYTFHEAQRLVAEAVSGLEEPYRSTVLLCYAQEIEPAEIARRQGIPAGTVRWRLKRGLDQVRTTLDARYGNDRNAWLAVLAPLSARAVSRLAPAAGAGAGWLGQGGFSAGKAVLGGAVIAAAAAAVFYAGARSNAPGPEDELRPRLSLREAAPPPRLFAAAAGPGAGAGPGAAPAGGPSAPAGPPPGVVAAGPPSPAAEADARRRAMDPGDAPVRGPAQAPVTIAVFSEFQCPFCARASETMRELEAAYPKEIRLVWRHLPLAFHQAAFLAAEAGLAAQEQGKFWEMHDKMFASQDRLDPKALEEHAVALGLDVAKWKAAIESRKYQKRIEDDLALANAAGVKGTPGFIINGEVLMGSQPLASFKHAVEVALAKVKGLPPPAAPSMQANRPAQKVTRFNPYWPVPALQLPDGLLGPVVKTRFVTGDAPMRGNAKAPVEIIYLTPVASQEARFRLEGLLGTYGDDVKVVAKIVPRPISIEAPTMLAEVAHYAQAQGKFWELHDVVAREMLPISRARFVEIGRQVGLDGDDLGAALDDGRYREKIKEDEAMFRALGIPDGGFVVGGRLAESSAALAQLIDTALRKAGRPVPPRPKSLPGAPLILSPTQEGYDPGRLFTLLSPRQIFALEPRDDRWAPAVEKELRPMVERDLRAVEPKVASTAVDCRWALCRVRWQSGKGDARILGNVARVLYAGIGRLSGAEAELYVAVRGAKGEPEAGLAALRSRRSTVIYNQRTGRGTNTPAKLPLDKLVE